MQGSPIILILLMKNSVMERLSHLSKVTQDAYGNDYVIYHGSPEPQSSA